ncbi:MAG: hypothetical protein AAGF15_04110 [Pseudomonadota bacterium]
MASVAQMHRWFRRQKAVLVAGFATALIIMLPAIGWTQTESTDPNLAKIVQSLVGTWQGTLEYRDFQSDDRVRIPVQSVEMSIHGNILLRKFIFQDGNNQVDRLSVATYDPEENVWREAYVGDGFVETYDSKIRVISYRAQAWRMEFLRDGEDNGRAAILRETMSWDGTKLTSLNEVRYKLTGRGEKRWQFRNTLTLTPRKG